MTAAHLARRGNSAHDALRRAMVQRLPGTLRARQAKAGALKVDKPFACVRVSTTARLSHRHPPISHDSVHRRFERAVESCSASAAV